MEKAGPPEKDSFDVTGISRSGRVRKKSYKLIDFEPDHNKSKKALKGGVKVGRGRPRKNPLPTKDDKSEDEEDMFMSTEADEVEGNEDFSDSTDEGSDDYENSNDSNVREREYMSIYMREKSNKRQIIKNGKVVYSKSFRKDKGKARCTAYMLWSNEIRKKITSSDPNLDFPTMSRKMGDMWSNVPKHEKSIWRRKAQGLGLKQKRTILKEVLNPSTPSSSSYKPHSTNTNFLNRPLKVRPKVTTVHSPSSSPLKVNDTTNIAAHFRLLGENLALIGDRLKEHDGQIAISGSLSVLLDSLLCSLGPLLCLTTQLPAINKNDLEANLGLILDNITYVMPGL